MGLSNFITGFQRTLIPLLLSSILHTTSIRGCEIPDENAIPCPVRWCENPETDFLCQPSDSSSFSGVNKSTCDSRTTKVFSHPGAPHTTVTLFQTNETWQHSPFRDPVLAALHSAIDDSLALFGTHAGTPGLPLVIQATVSLAADPARAPVTWQSAFNKALLSPSQGNICHLSIAFPAESQPVTPLLLRQLQRHFIRNLYYCVVQYHHPGMWWSLLHDELHDSLGTPWWRAGIANFFATSLRPTTPEDLAGRPFWQEVYPEEYFAVAQPRHRAMASAILWHWALQAGWTVERVSRWMAGHEVTWNWNLEQTVLAADADIRELFHGFGRAYVEGGIRYAAGNKTIVVVRPEPIFDFEFWWNAEVVKDVVKFEADDGSLDLVPGLEVRPWVVTVVEVPIAREQIVNASMSMGDYVIGNDGLRRSLTEEERETLAGDLQWSYRRKGTVELTRGPQAGMNSWARIVTQSAENATLAEREEPMVFEFVLTVTGDYMETQILFKVEPGMI
ncbi:hypothetical protein B0T18DRAFT_426382 [Schizothecium vesticola]|uniref:Uncharacterized protein n=1 Tax=Schizothecium vesticola TaxID=314040 RepID=A0AA40F6L0_9PEZI|nr:hypothetical protein B0T18DRAFT_426382 [Schizothecium vesticola]